MSFYGAEFLYSSISSSMYDVRILDFETGGTKDSPAGSEAQLLQKFITRKPSPYLYGTTRNTPLEISMTIGSLGYTGGFDRTLLEKWLLGSQSYQNLQIVQEDLDTVLYKVIFDKSDAVYIGNLNVGLKLHGYCNAPWAWTFPRTLTRTYSGSVIAYDTFTFYNDSDDSDYLYPSAISFRTNGLDNNFSLRNDTDRISTDTAPVGFGGRVMTFTGLSTNETITVDCYKQTIVSSTGLMRMSKFNRKFIRMVPGYNSLSISGGMYNFNMTYSLARKVGT